MLDHLEDMLVLNMIFGRSGTAPKALVKRRASPLKESARDEEDETSDCPMEQVADENPSASQQPDNVNMEQADYDRDTDNDDDPDEEEQPPAGNPKSKATPHPKLVPKSPPPTLRLVSKAPKNTLDEETESDNNPGERPALPRRPAMRTHIQRSVVYIRRITYRHLPLEDFWNSRFLTFVAEHYRERSTIPDSYPDFRFIPEHEREPGARVFWLRARLNDYWQPTLQGEGQHAERQYMDFIKKVYSICCYTNAQPEDFGTDIVPMVRHNRMIDLDRTVQNVEQVCSYFHMDPSKAKQITDLILWRSERLSRLFSGRFRHDPNQGTHRERRRQVEMNPDGSVELYDALGCITHARNFMGNKPGLFLMTMFPDYGKARFEIAFVYPSVDGSYKERKDKGCIIPRNRWIDNLTSRSAYDALRPDGRGFLNDPEMEFYVRRNSGHTRQVDLQYFGRPLWPGQKREPRQEEPDYDLPTESIPPSPHPSRSDAPHEDEGTARAKSRMRRPAPPSIEEQRKIKPFAKKPITFMFHA